MLKGVRHDFLSIFFVSQNQKTLQGTLLCCDSESVWYRISFWTRRGEYQYFQSKNFCLTLPKNFVEEPFSVSLISGIEKVYASDGYLTIFRRSFIVSQYRKTLQGNPSVLCFRKFPVEKKSKDKRSSIRILRQKIFVLQFRKNS